MSMTKGHTTMDDVKIGEILLPGEPDRQEEREDQVRAKFWPKMKRVMSKVPFARDAVAAYYCATDPKTPFRAKGVLFAALGYFVMPMDVVPDVFAVIGFTDDIAVLTAAAEAIGKRIRLSHDSAGQLQADIAEKQLVADLDAQPLQKQGCRDRAIGFALFG